MASARARRDALGLAARQRPRPVRRRGRRGRRAPATSAPGGGPRPRRTPRARSPNATFSSADRLANRRYDWNTTPIGRRSGATNVRSPGRRRRCSSIAIRPRSIGSSPASARRTVDLPAPLGPRMATISPRPTVELDVEVEACRAAAPIVGLEASCRRSCRAVPAEPAVAEADEHGERHDDQDEAEHQRLLRVVVRARCTSPAASSGSCPGSCRRT